MQMNSSTNTNNTAPEETWSYFEFICHPFPLIQIKSLNKLLSKTDSKILQGLGTLLNNNNLECFQIKVKCEEEFVFIFYLDIENPLIFLPVSSDKIEIKTLNPFLKVAKVIRSVLSNQFNQQSEILLIRVKEDRQSKKDSFTIYKADEQRKEKYKKDLVIKLTKGRKKVPFGKRSKKNKLNLLTGREWIRLTKSWFILRPPRRVDDEVLHPAKFPEKMIRTFITFFTKPGELVLDPFLGSGSTLMAAKQSNRNGIGIELSERYIKISRDRIGSLQIAGYPPHIQTKIEGFWRVLQADSLNIKEIWAKNMFSKIDFIITSPPYWSQLDRNEIRQKERKEKGLDTRYSTADPKDLGNIIDYQTFLSKQKRVFDQIYELTKDKGYLVVITNNVFVSGHLVPLAYDTAITIGQKWVLKDEKIWLQDDKRLLALGVNNAWVGNRCHQYCLIFRKE
jgi:DNA modification methylase